MSDLSNLSPRSPLPPPAAPAICRVQPLVPELSLFVPGHGAPPPPPQPHLPPTHHLLPQSDLSRQFHRTEATLFLSGSNSDILPRKVQWSDQQSPQSNIPPAASYNTPVVSHHPDALSQASASVSRQPPTMSQIPSNLTQQPPAMSQITSTVSHQPHVTSHSIQPEYHSTPPASNRQADWRSPVHPDILSVLTWQNEQLARLQDQVSRLLAASPAEVKTNTRDVAVGSPVLRRAATVSTNTSGTNWPAQPLSQGVIHGGEMEMVSQVDLGKNPVSEGISSHTSRESLGKVTPVKAPLAVGGAWESPVLGESVSMYERESQLGSEREEQEMYENILGKVRRLLSQGETQEEARPPPPPQQKEVKVADPPNQTEATWERLKQLGVSFISPADLAPTGTSSEQPYNSVWLPQAKLPSLLDISSTPDSSLAINNLALKYLSDQELAKLATLHNKKDKKGETQSVNPTDLSLASHQFLAKYGLESKKTNTADSEQDLRQPEPSIGHQSTDSVGLSNNANGASPALQPLLPRQPPASQPLLPSQSPAPQPLLPSQSPPQPQFERLLDITAIRQQSKLL